MAGRRRPGGSWRERCCPPDAHRCADGRCRGAVTGVLTVDHPVADRHAGPHSRRQFGVDQRADLGEVLGLQAPPPGSGRRRSAPRAPDPRPPAAPSSGSANKSAISGTQFAECLGAGRDGCRRSGPGTPRAPPARPTFRATAAAPARRSGRSRRGRRRSGTRPGSAGRPRHRWPALRAVGGLALGTERRIQRQHHRLEPGEVDVIACPATQPVEVGDQRPPRRPAPPRLPTRCRPAAAPACPWPARSATAPRTSRRAPASVACHEACGPVAPKSVTDMRDQVVEAVGQLPRTTCRTPRAWPGMPAVDDDVGAGGQLEEQPAVRLVGGSSTVLRLLALCRANGMLTPSSVGSCAAGIAAAAAARS